MSSKPSSTLTLALLLWIAPSAAATHAAAGHPPGIGAIAADAERGEVPLEFGFWTRKPSFRQ